MRLTKSATDFRFEMIVNLSKAGKTQQEIGALTNCSQAMVSKVLKRYKAIGQEAFKTKQAPGKSPKLDKASLEVLSKMLLEGALEHEFATDNWTRERIKKLIEDKFSVSYSAAHVSRLVKKLGFTLQKPVHKSYQKPEQEVKEWKENILPSLKKS